MLLNNLYTFFEMITEGNTIKATVRLDPSHHIFKGHFPGEPVLPGVCQVDIVKELLEAYFNKQIKLIGAADIKFLSIIIPKANKLIQIELKFSDREDGTLAVDARLWDDMVTFFKFKGMFKARS